jgi:hypothetical protein
MLGSLLFAHPYCLSAVGWAVFLFFAAQQSE